MFPVCSQGGRSRRLAGCLDAIGKIAAAAWTPAHGAEGQVPPGAWDAGFSISALRGASGYSGG